MPVEFLSDAEAAAYGRYDGGPSRAELDRVFFLDDADRELIEKRRGEHNRLGFALQLTTARWLGVFLPDPTAVPKPVLSYVAGQLEVEDPSVLRRYLERRRTRFEHAEEIKTSEGLRDFAAVSGELEEWAAARAYMTGDGPRAIFTDAVGWLRERRVLLPGVTTLARLVARARADGDGRLWETLAALPTLRQARVLDGLLDVGEGFRFSDLERWRKGPADPTGKSLRLALRRVAEIHGLDLDASRAQALVPTRRRLIDLARYGLAATAPRLRRHPRARRTATLVATIAHLQAASIDDCLELFDLIMTTELLGKAERETNKQRAREHPRLARASAKLALAVEALLEVSASGTSVPIEDVWRKIETVVDRAELRAAVEVVGELAADLDEDDEGGMRARLSERIRLVSGFLRELCEVIELGSNAEAAPVLREMRGMPWLLHPRRKLTAENIDDRLVRGSWRRLVYGQSTDGTVDRNAYVFCVLTQFHRHLKRRDIYAPKSSRWRDPRAQLLSREAWANTKGPVLRALGLPEDPTDLLDEHARALDSTYREVAARIEQGTEVTVDDDGKLHISALQAIPDPPSLTQLRKRVQAMLPRVGLPEVILEVMSWLPGFVPTFTSVSGGRSRLEDLHVSIAACLAAHAMNIDLTETAKRGAPALERGRLSHVNQNYLGTESYAAANPHLVDHQAGIPYARALGGGMVAGIDGVRFVVPIPSIYARPNRKYFGPDRGVTYLNMISDQAVGLAGKVVSGAPRDSLHALDVAFSLDHGQRPDILISDTGAYSDLMFGLCQPLGIDYRPELSDMPDQRAWRVDRRADYGQLNQVARGRLDLAKIHRHWPDILRVIASIYTGAVRAYDVTRVLQRDGNPTPLGKAIHHYGRIFKSLHILALIDDEGYRRDVHWIRNLQEGRHALARKVFHGSKGELYQRYREGMEDQLGALGLVLNCIVLWNTVYINAALEQLRAAGYPVLDQDVRRLHPFMRRHLAVQGDYSFLLPALDGQLRELRDPTEGQDEDEEDGED